ncbi:hypothetical protein Nepgr_029770 [Nepenthes gracilis]|uniref:Uncharacterized protein n=1 Tax=Nepenthes gracilis TaxID=150966 RepID=A0AAD3Y3A8_NEPGR|nr:hypothetical protein Nepgr_029770 [Nepenthes gracilis]
MGAKAKTRGRTRSSIGCFSDNNSLGPGEFSGWIEIRIWDNLRVSVIQLMDHWLCFNLCKVPQKRLLKGVKRVRGLNAKASPQHLLSSQSTGSKILTVYIGHSDPDQDNTILGFHFFRKRGCPANVHGPKHRTSKAFSS